MPVGIPQFRRCCFCLPLRPGLLAWGYFKIIADLLITPVALTQLWYCLYFLEEAPKHYVYIGHMIIWSHLLAAVSFLTFLMFVVEFAASIMFVIAAHKKNVGLVRGYYIYSIVVFVISTHLFLLEVVLTYKAIRGASYSAAVCAVMFVGYLIFLLVQAYFILLVRSQMIKLKARRQCKFVNNTTEAQGMMGGKQNETAVGHV
ncbi:hypothetical protein PYW07_012076 [Mythimna separata]|uniref:Uncharacterized protein n=1 Tax=Mythimna separata TaxID=271217 RepID=A0AAD7YLL5_MYTSE|nr:hypothetical protein PYW07_012076 [Mythimna separata]